MSEKFYTILTNVGLAAIANAQVAQAKVDFATFVVGDGNGAYYNPTAAQTTLVKEVWRGPISGISVDESNANWVVIEAVIPSTVGGFSVREIGVLDTNGQLLAIGKVPETYKPVTAEGSLKDLYLRMILEISNAGVVTLKVDPAVIFASKKYVDDQITINIKPLQNHINNTDVHTTHNEKNAWNSNVGNLAAHMADLVKHGVYGVATGTNALVMNIENVPAYPTGMLVAFKNTTANTGAVTLNVNGLGAKSIRKANGSTLASGNLKAGGVYQCRYDGTSFFLLGEGGEYGTALAKDVRSTKTFGMENGVVQGALDLSKLIASNIRAGVSIDGVLGDLIPLSGERKWANGLTTTNASSRIVVRDLSFRPSIILAKPNAAGTANRYKFEDSSVYVPHESLGIPNDMEFNLGRSGEAPLTGNTVIHPDGFDILTRVGVGNVQGWLAIE